MKNSANKIIIKKRGFTLVEVMIAVMLTTIVLSAIFMVWSKVTLGISRSHTKQQLQNEMRKIANYMQNDFKSIKFDENTFKLAEGGNGNFTMTFEKFKEVEEDKLAQDSVETVTYALTNTLLTRENKGKNILSVHCDGISIERATANGNLQAGDLELADEDFKAGRDAKLDITITGKMVVPGSGEEMYHVEKTSVVMRNEYSKNTNKTFISNFDLAKLNTSDVIQEGDQSGMQLGGELDLEYLKTLDDDTLNGMEATQKEMLEQAQNSLKDLNKAIDDTETGESGWSKFWNGVAFWDKSEGETVRDMRSDLKKAKTKEEVEKVKDELVTYTKDREISFLQASTSHLGTPYQRMDDKEKEIYRKAYDMAVQDRTLKGGYEKQKEEDETLKPPTLMIDTLNGKTRNDNGDLVDLGATTITNADGSTTTVSGSEITEENKAIIEAYNNIKLDWMGEFGEEDADIGAYNAAKQLISQADTKLEILKMETTCNDNIEKIQTAKNEN